MILSDICEFIVDCPHSTAPDEGAGYPLIRTPNIGKGRLMLDGVHRVSEKVYEERTQRGIPQDGDLIFAREAPAGNVALVTNGEKVCLGQRTVLIRPKQEEVNPEFLVYYLLSPQQQYELLGTANGATVAHVNLPVIRNLPINIPERCVQDKIANILSSFDNLIENNQKQIKLLEEAAQRLYKEWFVDLRFPGYEGTEIVDGVPSGWKKTVLNEVFSFERGKSYASKELSDSEGVVLVNLKNIQAWGGYKREAEKRFIGKYKESQTVEFGDIVMAVTDMTQERRLVGHVALVPDLGEKATYSMDLIKLIPSKGINSFFLYSSLRYSGIAENISKHANGTNVLHLKPDSIMGLEYIIPSAELMDLFGSMVETICKKVEVLQSQMILLSNARDRLLPKLMSGEIEV